MVAKEIVKMVIFKLFQKFKLQVSVTTYHAKYSSIYLTYIYVIRLLAKPKWRVRLLSRMFSLRMAGVNRFVIIFCGGANIELRVVVKMCRYDFFCQNTQFSSVIRFQNHEAWKLNARVSSSRTSGKSDLPFQIIMKLKSNIEKVCW